MSSAWSDCRTVSCGTQYTGVSLKLSPTNYKDRLWTNSSIRKLRREMRNAKPFFAPPSRSHSRRGSRPARWHLRKAALRSPPRTAHPLSSCCTCSHQVLQTCNMGIRIEGFFDQKLSSKRETGAICRGDPFKTMETVETWTDCYDAS